MVGSRVGIARRKRRHGPAAGIAARREVVPGPAVPGCAPLGQELGYRAFPLSLASMPLPELRVGYFNEEGPPTLLDALFSDNLQNLP